MAEHKRAIIDRIIEIKLRMDRGLSWIYWPRNLVLMGAGVKYVLNIGTYQTIMVMIGGFFVVVLLGFLDYDVVHYAQREAEITTGKYNPFFKRLGEKHAR
jgi:hypothetical protein